MSRVRAARVVAAVAFVTFLVAAAAALILGALDGRAGDGVLTLFYVTMGLTVLLVLLALAVRGRARPPRSNWPTTPR